jgi:hypothetical protein
MNTQLRAALYVAALVIGSEATAAQRFGQNGQFERVQCSLNRDGILYVTEVMSFSDQQEHDDVTSQFYENLEKHRESEGPRPQCLFVDDDRNKKTVGSSYSVVYRTIQVRSIDELDRNWRSSSPATDIKTLSLLFKPPSQTSGYNLAYIDLRYRFIVCAGEVQVAYSLDRKSLRSQGAYLVVGRAAPENILNPPLPDAPMTVDLNATVRLGSGARDIAVFEFRDAIAGESLGMGCFDGQTRKVGTVKELFGANVTPPQVKFYLDQMRLTAKTLPMVLTNPALRSPASDHIAERERKAKSEADALATQSAAEKKRMFESYLELLAESDEREAAEYRRKVAEAAAAKAAHDDAMRKNVQERAAYEAAAAKHRADMEAYRQKYPDNP